MIHAMTYYIHHSTLGDLITKSFEEFAGVWLVGKYTCTLYFLALSFFKKLV